MNPDQKNLAAQAVDELYQESYGDGLNGCSEEPDLNSDQSSYIVAPLKAHKGRGAVSNLPGRFETRTVETVDDGWWQEDSETCEPAESREPGTFKTFVTEEFAKTILSRNNSPDLPFSVSLNPYRGCEHGCIYCFARPTHAYLGLSPGLDFETKLYAKVNAASLLRRELAHPSYAPSAIALGVNTDCYQPCDRKLQITRQVLSVLHECEHPVGVITKSSLIERDIDLLAAMASKQQAVAAITITTLDHTIARTLEPRAASPRRRLETIRRLAQAGIPVSVSVAPIIPFVTEQELENVLAAAADAGATGAGYTVLRLPLEVNPLFQQWLQAHFPERAERVMNCVRAMRGGKDYDSNFATRMRGEGIWADLFKQRFQKAVKRFGLNRCARFTTLDGSRFRKPLTVPPAETKNPHEEQLDFFSH